MPFGHAVPRLAAELVGTSVGAARVRDRVVAAGLALPELGELLVAQHVGELVRGAPVGAAVHAALTTSAPKATAITAAHENDQWSLRGVTSRSRPIWPGKHRHGRPGHDPRTGPEDESGPRSTWNSTARATALGQCQVQLYDGTSCNCNAAGCFHPLSMSVVPATRGRFVAPPPGQRNGRRCDTDARKRRGWDSNPR